MLLLAGVLTVLLSSCSWTAGPQYFIHWGPARDDVIIRQRTSWDLTLARDLFYDNNDIAKQELGGFTCHANRSHRQAVRCVMRLLHRQTTVPGLVKGVWSRATADDEPVRFDDFYGAFNRVRDDADNKAQVAACLTLSVYPHTLNWTERSRSDSNCRLGEHAFG
jgi:hypothetical protein